MKLISSVLIKVFKISITIQIKKYFFLLFLFILQSRIKNLEKIGAINVCISLVTKHNNNITNFSRFTLT